MIGGGAELGEQPDDVGVLGRGREPPDEGAQREAAPVHHLLDGVRTHVFDKRAGEVELEQDRHGRTLPERGRLVTGARESQSGRNMGRPSRYPCPVSTSSEESMASSASVSIPSARLMAPALLARLA